jgi:hypothetical protein
MAYVVARPGKSFEVREARATAAGPRSRTIATFHVLDDAVLARAEARAGHALDRDAVRRSARKVGAPVEAPAADAAAGALLAELAHGRRPTPVRAKLLAAALRPRASGSDDHHLRAAGEWAVASLADRGDALRDLLALADAFPAPRRHRHLRFPRLRSAP